MVSRAYDCAFKPIWYKFEIKSIYLTLLITRQYNIQIEIKTIYRLYIKKKHSLSNTTLKDHIPTIFLLPIHVSSYTTYYSNSYE